MNTLKHVIQVEAIGDVHCEIFNLENIENYKVATNVHPLRAFTAHLQFILQFSPFAVFSITGRVVDYVKHKMFNENFFRDEVCTCKQVRAK